MKKYRQPVITIIKFLIGILLLILSIQGIDWIKVKDCLIRTDVFWFFLAVLFILLGLAVKILRWK